MTEPKPDPELTSRIRDAHLSNGTRLTRDARAREFDAWHEAERTDAVRNAFALQPKPDPEVARLLNEAADQLEKDGWPLTAKPVREAARLIARLRRQAATIRLMSTETSHLRAVIAEAIATAKADQSWYRASKLLAAASADQPATREDESFVDPERWRSVFPKPGGLNAYYRFPDAVNTGGVKVTHKPRTRAEYEADQETNR